MLRSRNRGCSPTLLDDDVAERARVLQRLGIVPRARTRGSNLALSDELGEAVDAAAHWNDPRHGLPVIGHDQLLAVAHGCEIPAERVLQRPNADFLRNGGIGHGLCPPDARRCLDSTRDEATNIPLM